MFSKFAPKTHFVNNELAQHIAQEFYPGAKNVRLIEHSYDNIVVLIDKTYALRFPRNEAALARSQYEDKVLQELAEISELEVPRILRRHNNPPYLVTSFLDGTHATSSEVRSWSESLQTELGEKIGRFAYTMHSLLPVEDARKIRKDLKLDEQKEEPWDVYFEKVFADNLPNEEQNEIARQYYDEWRNLRVSPDVVLHDDLHTENMLFQDKHLTGILDFGDTNIGSPEQELRQLYRIDKIVHEAAVKKYEQLSGQRLNSRALEVWAIVQELAVYTEHSLAGEYSHHAFARASQNLNRWLHMDIWGRGLVGADTESRQ